MTTMIAEVYDALLAAGSPEDKARKAAEAIASYENRFAAIDQRFAKVEGDLNLLKRMVGFNLAISVGIIVILLRH
jgi:phage shock protein A